eukprot:361258_1
MSLLLSIIMINAVLSDTYSTNFSSFDAANWVLSSGCMHCEKHGGNQCTQMSPKAISFGSVYPNNTGATITTSKLSTQTSCGAYCESGHMEYNKQLLYAHIKVIVEWYPPISNSNTTTGEGFIGFDSKGNEGSITIGFHGDDKPWPYQFTTDTYANVSNTHQEVLINTTESLSGQFNTFEIIWTQNNIQWIFNNKMVREETDKQWIPQMPMVLRLHDRSQNCPEMAADNIFLAKFVYFECTTL